MSRRIAILSVVTLAAVSTPAFAQTGFVNMIDHVHLGAPDQAQAVEWYHKHSPSRDRLLCRAARP